MTTTRKNDAIEAGIEAASEAVNAMPKGQNAWGDREYEIAHAAASAAVAAMITKRPTPDPVVAPGDVFTRWTVLRFVGKDTGRNKVWQCRCNCGNEKPVKQHHLRSGASASCGCLKDEIATGSKKPTRPPLQTESIND